jgi:hypothetical protein
MRAHPELRAPANGNKLHCRPTAGQVRRSWLQQAQLHIDCSVHLQVGKDIDEGCCATEGHQYSLRVPCQKHFGVLTPLPQQLEAVEVVQLQCNDSSSRTRSGKEHNMPCSSMQI